MKATLVGPDMVAALRAYLAVRGSAASLPEQLFTYRHRPLANYYCYHWLYTYSKRCGLWIHQLRHSCATLWLTAGALIVTVQLPLGHEHIDTTLSYAQRAAAEARMGRQRKTRSYKGVKRGPCAKK